jgi:hypothetical protein
LQFLLRQSESQHKHSRAECREVPAARRHI